MKKIYYLKPSSFCMWVNRAISEINNILEKHKWEKIICVHEIVHNKNVNDLFIKKWITFVDSIDEINDIKSIVVFSAHWINRKTLNIAKRKFKYVYNLECPLVSKVYNEVLLFKWKWIKTFFYIWKKGHQEAENVMWYMKHLWADVYCFLEKKDIPDIDKKQKIWLLSQTTLNFEYVKNLMFDVYWLYPNIKLPNVSDICKATYDRQSVLKKNLSKFDTVIVVWWKNSSNTKELVRIWKNWWKKVFFVLNLDELKSMWIDDYWYNLAITWWASTPEDSILEIYNFLWNNWYYKTELVL